MRLNRQLCIKNSDDSNGHFGPDTTVLERSDDFPATWNGNAEGNGVETSSSAAASRTRILVVEDHDETREVLANLLRHIGHEVVAAGSAGDALKAMGATKVDILVSDIGLPDGSGYALLAQARQAQPALRAIALTGFTTSQDAKFSREAGFDFHLTKPLDFHELRTLLAQLTDPSRPDSSTEPA